MARQLERIGLVAAGMARQRYDLSLTRYDDRGWRASFYVTGIERSPTGATASAFEQTPWLAVQRAAWKTLAVSSAMAGAAPAPARLRSEGTRVPAPDPSTGFSFIQPSDTHRAPPPRSPRESDRT